jgi:hypothetical protein
MGLSLEVGMLADLKESDNEGFLYYQGQFDKVNQALSEAGLPAHHEPTDLPQNQIFFCDMWGYSGIHHLSRIAAYIALGKELPGPGDINSSKDPVVKIYFKKSVGTFWSILIGRKEKKLSFEHLMKHSDAEGYYIPVDFSDVIFTRNKLKIAGWMIGSTQRLYEECKKLAGYLELPLDLHHESDGVLTAAENQGQGKLKWQKYGVESFTCLCLLRACEASLKTGAAIVFC